jgi:TPR repeat protein
LSDRLPSEEERPTPPHIMHMSQEVARAHALVSAGDTQRAIEIFEKYAKQGVRSCMVILHQIYMNTYKDAEKSTYWLQMYVEHEPSEMDVWLGPGMAEAMQLSVASTLGYIYWRGIFMLRQDIDKADKWLRIASGDGTLDSKHMYAIFLLAEIGSKEAHETAHALFLSAAQEGFGPSMLQLSKLLIANPFAEKDMDESERWLQKALDAG